MMQLQKSVRLIFKSQSAWFLKVSQTDEKNKRNK
nr:MAG TPA: hypothetical protein [Caudoviricetes sp.]